MLFIFLIFLLFYIIIVLLFEKPLFTEVNVNTDQSILALNFYWIYPFLTVEIGVINYCPIITVYLFKKKVFSKPIKQKIRKNYHSLGNICFSNSKIELLYGLNNPFLTGILNGFFALVRTLIPDVSLCIEPDFLSNRDYVILKGNSKINLGKSLIRTIQAKLKIRRNANGTVKYGG